MQVSIGNSSENEGWDVPFPSSMTASVQFFSSLQVTALAAVQKLEGKGNIMGISMGSSEGAGYANAEGHLSTARTLGK
jgi:hypothetical protein